MAHRGLETECANSVAFRRLDEAFGQETDFWFPSLLNGKTIGNVTSKDPHACTLAAKEKLAHRGLETECANSVAFRRLDEAFGQETDFWFPSLLNDKTIVNVTA